MSAMPHCLFLLPNFPVSDIKLTDELSMQFRTLFSSNSKLESFDFSDTKLTDTFFTTLAATPVFTSRSVPARLSFEARNCVNLTQPRKSAPFPRDTHRASVFLTNSLSFANCLEFTDKMTMHILYSLTPTYSIVLTTLDLAGCCMLLLSLPVRSFYT